MNATPEQRDRLVKAARALLKARPTVSEQTWAVEASVPRALLQQLLRDSAARSELESLIPAHCLAAEGSYVLRSA